MTSTRGSSAYHQCGARTSPEQPFDDFKSKKRGRQLRLMDDQWIQGRGGCDEHGGEIASGQCARDASQIMKTRGSGKRVITWSASDAIHTRTLSGRGAKSKSLSPSPVSYLISSRRIPSYPNLGYRGSTIRSICYQPTRILSTTPSRATATANGAWTRSCARSILAATDGVLKDTPIIHLNSPSPSEIETARDPRF